MSSVNVAVYWEISARKEIPLTTFVYFETENRQTENKKLKIWKSSPADSDEITYTRDAKLVEKSSLFSGILNDSPHQKYEFMVSNSYRRLSYCLLSCTSYKFHRIVLQA